MIIGISGKLSSGKDLTGKIIQALVDKPTCFDNMDIITEENINYKVWDKPGFVTKRFADTLKDFICMLLGCTREKLEDRKFKEGILPEEWWYYKLGNGTILPRGYYPNEEDNRMCEQRYLVKTTPRLLLQLMGTECGRKILHPNIWINSVMSNYKKMRYTGYGDTTSAHVKMRYPNWVITDMRFPNELKAVQNKKGITIRINRNLCNTDQFKDEHPSETALDNAIFKYTINNNGTIKELVDKIKKILIKEKLI